MSQSPAQAAFPDTRDRQIAVGTFDRNLVVTAGAGTGKTTLLVDRLVHLILRNPEPLKVTEIVALTFTNKAAAEMKLRLRERLQSYLAVELQRGPASAAERKHFHAVQAMVAQYQLSKDEIDGRIRDALRNLERSDIGTIHSFAANILRLYPIEAGVDPQFHEDDGAAFDRLFDEQWDAWLDQELALQSANGEDWRKVLARCQLDQIKALARSLASETVDLEPAQAAGIAAPLRQWLARLSAQAKSLNARHTEERMNEKLVRAAHAVIYAFETNGRRSEELADRFTLLTEKSVSRSLKGWSAEDIAAAQELVRAAKGLISVDGDFTALLWHLLAPFAAAFRERFLHDGHISFDGLLVRARDLVRDHRRMRAELKRRYRSILIDEFQDTDPIQYEILLYLAERPEQSASDWRRVQLQAGKLFIVGDPKQSIYAFRRADIEAYLEVVEKIVLAQNGVECRLTTNFRSDSAILEAVNGAFAKLILPQAGLQPPYVAIAPPPGRPSHANSLAKLSVRKIIAPDDQTDAETARRIEGESLARWLKDSVLSKAQILNPQGETVHVQPKDIAILMRKLTDIHDYLEPLRRQGIRYVVEGERHFYATKEIVDAVNLLRAVENPYDRLALVGVLRSDLGALTDRQIYHLHLQNRLNYRESAKLDETEFPATLIKLYKALATLNIETRTLPVGAAVDLIFSTLPVESLAACHFHGEQAVANLAKLRQQAEQLGRDGPTTLKTAIRQLEQRVLDVKDEGESVLAEENLDAVRIMSIHKAKGLEFPIVILAGCQTGVEGRRSVEAESVVDWSTNLTGTRVGQIADLAGLYIDEKNRLRNVEEQKRLLYVAMTRAREHLILSCAPSNRRSSGSFQSMFDSTINGAIAAAQSSTHVALGGAMIEIEAVHQNLSAPSQSPAKKKRSRKKPDWKPYLEKWAGRAEVYKQKEQATPFLTPTQLKRREEENSEAGDILPTHPPRNTPALVIGDLTHRFLQTWQFGGETANLDEPLRRFVDGSLPVEFTADRATIESELREILDNYFRSEAYGEFAGAKILGREVPLLMPWNGQIMEGVIDLIYEKNGLLYLADYKTDRIKRGELRQGAERYRQQAEIYVEAARKSLNRQVAAFKLIFLRLGETIEVRTHFNKEWTLF